MVGDSMNCDLCDRQLATENDERRGICFKCHVSGIRFGFRGVEYGQKAWNNSTIRETQKMYESMPGVEKIPARKELI